MQSLQTAVNVVAPMFLMLALGCLLRIGGLLDRGALERLNNVCFKVFLSLLLYYLYGGWGGCIQPASARVCAFAPDGDLGNPVFNGPAL